MTREKFENFMKNNGSKSFQIILINGNTIQPLNLISEDENGIEVMLNGLRIPLGYYSIDSCIPIIPELMPSFPAVSANSTKIQASEPEKISEIILTFPDFCVKDRKQEIKQALKQTGMLSKWSSIYNSFQDAKKNNCLNDKADSLIQKLDNWYYEDEHYTAKLQLGEIFVLLKDYETASEEYLAGKDYENAFTCSLLAGKREEALSLLAKWLLSGKNVTEHAVTAFFMLSAEYKKGAFCVDTLERHPPEQEKNQLYCQGCQYLLQAYQFCGHLPEDENFAQFLALLKETTKSESFTPAELPEEISTAETYEPEETFPEQSNQKFGTITYYDSEKKYGFINKNDYFYISQVEDNQLRSYLYQEGYIPAQVSYVYGCGKTGKSADHIQLTAPLPSTEIEEGFICDFKSYDNFGKVSRSDGKKLYNFRLEAVIDPYLKQYMENELKVSDIEVEFYATVLNGKNIIKKMWLAPGKFTESVREDYRKSVTEKQKKQFEKEMQMISGSFLNTAFCPDYQELELWEESPLSVISLPEESEKNESLPKIHPAVARKPKNLGSVVNPCERALHYLKKENDLEKAEKYFLIAIEQKDNLSSAVPELTSLYMRNKQVEAALSILETYKDSIQTEKYYRLLIQILEKKQEYQKLADILEQIIPQTYTVTTKLHDINKLGHIYMKLEEYEKSLEKFNYWKNVKKLSQRQLGFKTAQYDKIEISVERSRAEMLYQLGKKDEAKRIAEKLYRKNAQDTVALSIIENKYKSSSTPSPDDDPKTDSILIDVSDVPQYALDCALNVKLDGLFRSYDISKYIKDDECFGEPEVIGSVLWKFHDKVMRNPEKIEITRLRNYWFAFAKIMNQFLKSGKYSLEQLEGEVRMGPENFRSCLGRGLAYAGDNLIQEKCQKTDYARYLYTLTLGLLKPDNPNFKRSFSMIIYSHFLSDEELCDITMSGKKDNISINQIPAELPNKEPYSIKNLLLSTFKIPVNHAATLRNMIWNSTLKDDFFTLMEYMTGETCQKKDEYNFVEIWKKSRECYEKFEKNLKSTISVFSQTNSSEKLKKCEQEIRALLESNFLFNSDENYLKSYLKIITSCIKLNDMRVFEDEEDQMKKIREECIDIMDKIRDMPTEISYDYLYENLSYVASLMLEQLNTLYEKFPPKLKVEVPPALYYKENSYECPITVSILNDGYAQKAEISNFKIIGVENHIQQAGNLKSTVSSVKGGRKGEYQFNIRFTDEEIKKTNFSFEIHFDYHYLLQFEEETSEHIKKIVSVNLYDHHAFQPIHNPYSSYTTGSGTPTGNMFKGRTKDIEAIVKMLKLSDGTFLKNRGIYMYGQKRAGKTSIMNHLQESIESAYPGRYIFVEYESIGELTANETFLRNFKYSLLDMTKDALEEKYPEILEAVGGANYLEDCIEKICQKEENSYIFNKIMRKINKELGDHTLMFLIDEFTYIYNYIQEGSISEEFPHFWKAFLQDYNVCAIVIGQDNMRDFVTDSRFNNDFGCMKEFPVTYLPEDGAKKLIIEPILDENHKSRFDEDAVAYFYEMTAGSAFLIMILGDKLVNYMNNTCTSRISRTTAEIFIKDFMSDSTFDAKRYFDPQLNDPSFYGKNQIQQDNKTLLRYIARNSDANQEININDIHCAELLSEPSEEYQKQLINKLITRNVLRQNGHKCSILVGLLREYLKGKKGESS